jgi:flavin-dependent dehydrogenase
MTAAPSLPLAEVARRAWDVVVIGAGPAGATSALLLARAGRRVLLVERKAFPRYKVCGGCLSAAGLRRLEQLGLGPALRALAAPRTARLELRAGGCTATLALPGGVSVSRSALDQLLVTQAVVVGVTFLPEVAAEVIEGSRYQVQLHAPALPHEIVTLSPAAIVVADGLGNPSVRSLTRFGQRVRRAARIGAGTILPVRLPWLAPGAVAMVVGDGGYVGMVEVEDGQTCVAAALDPSFLRRQLGIDGAVRRLLADAGLQFEHEPLWTGTPALTRQATRHADRNVFLVGDASGYVEPFTGEGMTWALSAAIDVVPFVEQALQGMPSAQRWHEHVLRTTRGRQRWCRAIAAGLRVPGLPTACARILRVAPRIAQPIVHWIAERRPLELLRGHS